MGGNLVNREYFSTTLTPETKMRLKDVSRRIRRPQSEIVEEALASFLQQYDDRDIKYVEMTEEV